VRAHLYRGGKKNVERTIKGKTGQNPEDLGDRRSLVCEEDAGGGQIRIAQGWKKGGNNIVYT